MADGLTFRLLGQGIAYSASPSLMAAAFTALGLPHRYVLADVVPDEVPATVAGLRAADAGGANVTVPHKATVAALMDELSDVAREAAAVNVVVRDGSRLIGHNTDLPATVDALRRLRPGGFEHAVVLGAGGAGRAVQLALAQLGAGQTSILRRSDGSMARLADELAAADLLVNATPVGTGSDESPVPAALLRPDLAVLDLVYRPSPTRLVREARAAGAPAEAGAGILLSQACRSLELWLGEVAPVESMRAALDAELGGRSDA
ncbi:MAG TPA: shikimate dehydrogenase [Candidatus Deferrimicrobium sp.]|nr:shikimate dehydrogenase [Candidatus Deferrimicrobium sp.]